MIRKKKMTIIPSYAASILPLGNIISEYKFENNVLDTVGLNDGVATDLTYATGLVGQEAVFNGTTSKVVIPDSDSLSFNNGVNDTPFSISLLIKFDVFNSNILFLNKFVDINNREYEIRWTDVGFLFKLYTNSNLNNISIEYRPTQIIGEHYHLIVTYDGSESVNGMNMYINAGIVPVNRLAVGSYIGMVNNLAPLTLGQFYAGLPLDGSMDCVRFWNKELTQTEITELATRELAGEDINP